jgi:hypothetical protein
MNPDNMLCEGQVYRDEQGNTVWEPTNFTAVNGETVYRLKCKTGANPSTLANNFDQVTLGIPKDGNGYVTVCTETSPQCSTCNNSVTNSILLDFAIFRDYDLVSFLLNSCLTNDFRLLLLLLFRPVACHPVNILGRRGTVASS